MRKVTKQGKTKRPSERALTPKQKRELAALAALADHEGYQRLTYLCYQIGSRLSGSTGLERAIEWSVEQMKAAGLSNVQVIPTKVPHWVRGAEQARMVAPLDKPLHMLGLGMSIGTPAGGITADCFGSCSRNGPWKLSVKPNLAVNIACSNRATP